MTHKPFKLVQKYRIQSYKMITKTLITEHGSMIARGWVEKGTVYKGNVDIKRS